MKENSICNILLVEDDPNMNYLIHENLSSKGYSVSQSYDGKDAYKMFREIEFQLCILDIMLPKMDGFQLATKIRTVSNSIPIIFLTSKSLESDKLQGFKIGCDDYITKPFSLMELDYRIQAILKRTGSIKTPEEMSVYRIGFFEFDYTARILRSPDKSEKKLTRKESELLRLFCEHKNSVINRSFLMNQIWGNDDYFISRSMDVYITRIRNLLKADSLVEISNIYGSGFRMIEKKVV
jgi:two-component system OmpR family response regulator